MLPGPSFSHSLPLNQYEKLTTSLFLVIFWGCRGRSCPEKRLLIYRPSPHSQSGPTFLSTVSTCELSWPNVHPDGRMVVLGSNKISSLVAWDALLLPLGPSASFPSSPNQEHAHFIQEAFPDLQPCPPIPPTTFNNFPHYTLDSCPTVSHITG